MNTLNRITILSVAVGILLLLASCDIGGSESEETADFDRAAMLENYGKNIIVPSYTALRDSIKKFTAAADSFSATPTEDHLEELQQTLKSVRLAWQHVNLFHFGPAESKVLRTSINTYPTDTSRIEENIDSGDYTLGTVANQDAAGLPALGYLLHGVGTDSADIVTAYTTASDASARKQYLMDNVRFVRERVAAVTRAWQPDEGDYLGMFLSEENLGTDAGSSFGMLVNALIQHYERFIRDGKIGIPSGIRSAGVPRPETTEAYYAGYSKKLAVENLEVVKRIYMGRSFSDGTKQLGLHQNLQALQEGELADEIKTKLEQAITSTAALNDPLAQQIKQDNEAVQSVFKDIQAVMPLLKTDMTSVLGITITYQDNDGD